MWKHSASASFPVSNGIRQGAVSSPLLFCIYLDGLVLRLENTKVGCLGDYKCYANDLTLLVSSATAMRIVLIMCEGVMQTELHVI